MKRRLASLVCGLVGIGGAVSGCGGGGGHGPPADCLQVQPCGGNVVGTWAFLGGCYNVAALNDEEQTACPGGSISAAALSLSGTANYDADLTYAFDAQETFEIVETVPLSCTTSTTCAELQAGFVSIPDPSSAVQVTTDATCTGTTTCNCRATLSIRGTVTGTYETSGTSISLTDSAGTGPTTSSYCVDDDRMHLMTLSTTMTTPMGTATIVVDTITQRR